MKKKKQQGFSFDFSALSFSGPAPEDDRVEVPKLSTQPAAFENAEALADPGAVAYAKRRLDNIMERFKVFDGPENQIVKPKKKNTGKHAFNGMIGAE